MRAASAHLRAKSTPQEKWLMAGAEEMPAPQFYVDRKVPYWQSSAAELYWAFGYGSDRADAWIRHTCDEPKQHPAYGHALEMRGRFQLGYLGAHTYTWTFTPGMSRGRAVVFPVFEHETIVDLLAISKYDSRVWGCVLGSGRFAGTIMTDAPVRVHKNPVQWLMSNCEGVLPLARYAYPELRAAPILIAEDFDHAWYLAEEVFVDPAFYAGLENFSAKLEDPCKAADRAEQQAFDRILIDATEPELAAELRSAA